MQVVVSNEGEVHQSIYLTSIQSTADNHTESIDRVEHALSFYH